MSRENDYFRDSGGSAYDRWKSTDPNPWPSTDDIEDMNLGVPYCKACMFQHSVNADWCKALKETA